MVAVVEPLVRDTFWTSRFGPRLVSAPQSVIRVESVAHQSRKAVLPAPRHCRRWKSLRERDVSGVRASGVTGQPTQRNRPDHPAVDGRVRRVSMFRRWSGSPGRR